MKKDNGNMLYNFVFAAFDGEYTDRIRYMAFENGFVFNSSEEAGLEKTGKEVHSFEN